MNSLVDDYFKNFKIHLHKYEVYCFFALQILKQHFNVIFILHCINKREKTVKL